MKPWKLILSFVVVFLLGGAAGGMISMRIARRMLFSPPGAEEMAHGIIHHFKGQLDLTPEQMRKIEPLVGRMTKELSATQKEMTGRTAEIFNKTGLEISGILTVEQQKKFDAMEAKRRKFMSGN